MLRFTQHDTRRLDKLFYKGDGIKQGRIPIGILPHYSGVLLMNYFFKALAIIFSALTTAFS